MVKNPLATQETWVQSLCQEDPPEKEMATHSSILAWKILWTRGAWSSAHKESDTAAQLTHKAVGDAFFEASFLAYLRKTFAFQKVIFKQFS